MQIELLWHSKVVNYSSITLCGEKYTHFSNFVVWKTDACIRTGFLELNSVDLANLLTVLLSQILVNVFPLIGDFRLDVLFSELWVIVRTGWILETSRAYLRGGCQVAGQCSFHKWSSAFSLGNGMHPASLRCCGCPNSVLLHRCSFIDLAQTC